MTAFSQCIRKNCNIQVDGHVKRCPTCNGPMRTSSAIRQTGWVMAGIGALIAAPMTYVVLAFLPKAMDPQGTVAAGGFGGPVNLVLPSMALLLITLAFGVLLLLTGLQRAIRAHRSPMAKPALFLLGAAMLGGFFWLGNALPDATAPHGATSTATPSSAADHR
ncbi:MAG: hypothetical protein ACKOUM_07920 [Sphingopyxis sp.]